MQTITPHLWFDREAKDAADLYVSLFPDSRVASVRTIHDTPSGDCDIVSFVLSGQPFMAISAGPLFRFNPAVSFQVKLAGPSEIDAAWERLADGGKVLMPLGSYPFSERFGWLEDRYGLSWQLMHAGGAVIRQRITPVLLFVGGVCGKAEEALRFYAEVFQEPEAGVAIRARYGSGEEPEREGTVKYGSCTLHGLELAAMDSARPHAFQFNEAVSLMVPCDTQEEIDHFWGRLSADPRAERCGWLKDRFGLSWQVVPARMGELMSAGPDSAARVTQAFLKMKKFDLAALESAARGA